MKKKKTWDQLQSEIRGKFIKKRGRPLSEVDENVFDEIVTLHLQGLCPSRIAPLVELSVYKVRKIVDTID